jgi:hypothetical protein
MKAGQGRLDLAGGSALIPDKYPLGELGAGDPMPDGPYAVGLTKCETGGGEWYEGVPWTVTCGTGQAIAGHVPSVEIAEAIAEALNRTYPT